MRHCFVPALLVMLACTACKNPPSRADQGSGTNAIEATSASTANYDRPGYVTAVVNDRLWVFRRGSKEHAEFQQHGEPTISVVRIGAGPGGMTLKAPDFDTLDGWLAAK